MCKLLGSATILIVAWFQVAYATDALIQGGKSPDGRYEVRICETSDRDPSNYLYAVVDTKTSSRIKELAEGGGVFGYKGALATASALWHPSGSFFALIDQGTRHSQELYIYEVTAKDAVLIHTPDYCQNALGRIGAIEGYLVSVVKPLQWDGDLLKCKLTFDASLPDQRGRSPAYEVEFTLRLMHGKDSATCVTFASMGKPYEKDGH